MNHRFDFFIVCIILLLAITIVKAETSSEWLEKGSDLNHLGKFEEALSAINKSIELNNNNEEAWRMKGAVLANLGRSQEALEAVDMAIKINPQSSFAWSLKGSFLSMTRKYDEAFKAFDKAIKIDSKNSNAIANKALLLFEVNRTEEAILTIDEALDKNNDAYIYSIKADFLERLGKNEEALWNYDKAIEISKNNSNNENSFHFINSIAYSGKSSLLEKLGRYEEALTAYDKVIEIDANKPEAFKKLMENESKDSWKHKGYLLQKLGKYEEALLALDKAIEIAPQDADTWNEKGELLINMGKYEEGIFAFGRAIEINPQHFTAWNNRREALDNMEIFWRNVNIDFYIEPSTGKVMNQLELEINSLFAANSSNMPKNIQFNFKFDDKMRIEKFILSNNSYSGKIKIDLDQRNDFPFEDYNATIFLFYDYQNQSKPFNITTSNKSIAFDSWGQPRKIFFEKKENRMEITMERLDKSESKNLYLFGLFIILAYFFVYLIYIVKIKKPKLML